MKILFFALILFMLTTQGYSQEINGTEFKRELVAAFEPVPIWWDDVEQKSVSLNDYKELLKFWQSEKRCCNKEEIQENNQIFVKSVYLRLKNGVFDTDLYAYGSKLLNISYIEHPRMLEVQEVVFKYFKDYKQPLDYCVNCKAGDTSLGVLSDMLKFYRQKGEYDKAIQMSLELLQREDLSNYKEANFVNKLSYLYERQGENKKAFDLVEKTIAKFILAKDNRAIEREVEYLQKRLIKLMKNNNQHVNGITSSGYVQKKSYPKKRLKNKFRINDNSFHFEIDEKDVDEFLERSISNVKSGVLSIFLISFGVVIGLFLLLVLLYIYQQKKFSENDDQEKSFSDIEVD